MTVEKRTAAHIFSLTAIFVLGGLIHRVFYGVDFTICITQLFFTQVVLLWGLSVRKRLIDRRVRLLLSAIVVMIVMYFLLQLCKYSLFHGQMTAERYLWYAYYIPMTVIPLLLLYLALSINKQETDTLGRNGALWGLPGGLLLLGIMTNDLHFFAFRFPTGILSDAQAVRGPLIWAFFVYFAGYLVLAFAIILRKCRLTAVWKRAWIPLLFPGVAFVYFVVQGTGWSNILTDFWNVGEVFAFAIVGFWDICIQIGLIPSNTDYDKLFHLTSMPMVISDTAERIVYTSAGTTGPLAETETVRIRTEKLHGGAVTWATDMEELYALNRQLKNATEQIKSRNEYLLTENSIQEERSTIDAQNHLYDRISEIVRPQLEKSRRMLDSTTEEDYKQVLAQVTVLNAYIKRRSNMELLQADKGVIPVKELVTALHESLEYMESCGVNGALVPTCEGELPGEMLILAYEYFEYIVESCLDTLTDIIVSVMLRGEELALRMMLKTDLFTVDGNWQSERLAGFGGMVTVTKEDNDIIAVISLQKGGDEA